MRIGDLVVTQLDLSPYKCHNLCGLGQGLLVWQDFPAGDGRALPLWDSARGTFEQSLGLNQPQADSQVLGVQMRQLTQALGLGE